MKKEADLLPIGDLPPITRKTRRSTSKHWIEGAVIIPPALQASPFLEGWQEWVPYFCFGKYGDQAPALRAQLRRLAAYSPAQARAILDENIAKGWRTFDIRAPGAQFPAAPGSRPQITIQQQELRTLLST